MTTTSSMMDCKQASIERAEAEDKIEILRLLETVALPTQGVSNAIANAFVARVEDKVVGCVALEAFGQSALLRSLAIDPSHRSKGLANALCAEIIAHAIALNLRTLYLLTASGAPFFAKLGFSVVERNRVPLVIAEHPQFRSICPASATCMSLGVPEKPLAAAHQ